MAKSSLIRRMLLSESTYLKLLFLETRQMPRTKWVSDLFQSREKYGEHHTTFKKLLANPELFMENFNVKPKTFYYILKKIGRHIKKTSNFRKCIDPEERLAVTLKYLTTGKTFRSLSLVYRMSVGAVREIVYTTCQVIWDKLGKKHMPTPNAQMLKKVARKYYKKFKFPNCVGTIDKELLWMRCTQAPYKYRYRKKVLLPLTGIADTNYKFIMVDVGQIPNDNIPEGLLADLDSGKVQLPPPEKVPDSDDILPHVFIATKFFPLKQYMLRPYAQRELNADGEGFNKSLSEVHKVIETTFNILIHKWRYLSTEMKIDVEKITTVLRCICVLHNVIIDKEGLDKIILAYAKNSTRRKVEDNFNSKSYNRCNKMVYKMRNSFKNYLSSRKQQDLLNDCDDGADNENPAKRRRLISSSSSSSSVSVESASDYSVSSDNSGASDLEDFDETESQISLESERDVDTEEEGADGEDEEEEAEHEIDIKDEPLESLEDDFDNSKPHTSTIEETYEIHGLDEDDSIFDYIQPVYIKSVYIKPDPDVLQEIKTESDEPNTKQEVAIKEELVVNSSTS